MLKSAETEASSEIIGLVNQRNELASGIVPPGGIIAKLKNWLTNRKIRFLDKRATIKKNSYLSQEHLVRVANQYNDEAHRMTRDHDGWYIYRIPSFNINMIKSELIDIQATSMVTGMDQGALRLRLLERDVTVYLVGGSEFVERISAERLINYREFQNPPSQPRPALDEC